MLEITVPKTELFDDSKQEFIEVRETVLRLEHSLVSLSKWESKWKKPFLSSNRKSVVESIDYIRCMTITQNVDPNVYHCITRDNIDAVNAYVDDSMTATWFSEEPHSSRNEVVTSEVIYYMMIALQIPFECQKWHLNRLLTLIRVCNAKNGAKDKKIPKSKILSRNRALNEARRKAMNSKG